MKECKHDFKTISEGSGGWESERPLFQCKKCFKLFCSDGCEYWEVPLQPQD